ncbi:uncharacterized protein SCODWIG_02624 [Saccharomycodes ludwigii]|uniref:Protein ICE2 n=1 Tax=Saccharomycodes ludwigii TaxID=36035 RepID=A0A376B845_9ASCO|nr:hypothetical protein SCDLUD_002763 [Saccharomycodes ludwigii]KAH3901274.1 hypothetical protein SCDLUD_002763 [Saccharomycodes ludwigii]SSD60863.1 uncharacterized protein SCODWIG_02624 [Saccharomycodes ludwigii]
MLSNSICQSLRVLITVAYLIFLILTIPISFQVGGVSCGLAFTVTLFNLYFISTTIKLRLFDSKSTNNFYQILYYLQHLSIPSLLFIFINIYSENKNITTNNNETIFSKLWSIYLKFSVIPWKFVLIHSTPYFTLLEGIFTILAIQTIGQAYKWLNRPSAAALSTVPKDNHNKGSDIINHSNRTDDKNRNNSSDKELLLSSNTNNETVLEEGEEENFIKNSDIKEVDYELTKSISRNSTADQDNMDLDDDGDDDDDDDASVSDSDSIISSSSTSADKSSAWSIAGLMFSAGIITCSLYYLYKIYATPNFNLSVIEATLVGFTFSLVCGIGLYGIISSKGSSVESSLLFAYIIRCIYEISPELSDVAMSGILQVIQDSWQQVSISVDLPSILTSYYSVSASTLSPSIVVGGHELIDMFTNTVRNIIKEGKFSTTGNNTTFSNTMFATVSNHLKFFYQYYIIRIYTYIQMFTTRLFPRSLNGISKIFFKMAKESITPAILMNLTFRLLVYYLATRIIPVIQRKKQQEFAKLQLQLQEQQQEKFEDDDSDVDIFSSNNNSSGITSNDSNVETVIINQEEGEAKELRIRQCKPNNSIPSNNSVTSSFSIMNLIYWYSPCILIAMYTHLIIQYSKNTDIDKTFCIWGCFGANTSLQNKSDKIIIDSWAFWNWCNIFCSLLLYALELKN